MRDNVRDASLRHASEGITIASKISTDRPGSDPAGRHIRGVFIVSASSVDSSSFLRVPWIPHRVPEFSGLTQTGYSVSDIMSERTRCVQPTRSIIFFSFLLWHGTKSTITEATSRLLY
jgi:hypothetical protein